MTWRRINRKTSPMSEPYHSEINEDRHCSTRRDEKIGMKIGHELSRGEQRKKLRNYARENFFINMRGKPVACLVTYVNSRVLGPSDLTVRYTLK